MVSFWGEIALISGRRVYSGRVKNADTNTSDLPK